jgi:hypothetical protein
MVVGGRCVTPDDHKRTTPEQCQAGTKLVEGACVQLPVCPLPQVSNADGLCGCPTSMQPGAIPGQCLCKQGSKMVGGQCVPDRKEPEKKKRVEQKCPEGTSKQGSKCVKRKTDEPRIRTEDVFRGIGIINGIGGGGRNSGGGGGGGGGGTRGGGSPGKP